MNVMLFSRIVSMAGVGNHITQLAYELANQGNNVIVVSSTNDRNISVEETANPRFVQLDEVVSHSPIALWGGLRKIHKLIIENSIDVVHSHHRMASLYMMFYRKVHYIPTVYTLHLGGIPHDFLHRVMTYAGDCSIGVSEEVCQFMSDSLKIPEKQIFKVLNGVDASKLLPLTDMEKAEILKKYNLPDNKVNVLMHSRIDPMKNQMIVVEAVHMLPLEARKKLSVIQTGAMEGEYYKQVIEQILDYDKQERENGIYGEYTIKNLFHFTGYVDTRDVMGIAHLLLLPCTKDGFALSVLEAFHMKVLVARTKTEGFKDTKYCLPISSKDPDDIVNLIINICKNGLEEYSERIKAAYHMARAEFTIEAMTRNTVKIYEKAIGAYRK